MSADSKPSLRVASWNIRKGLGTDLRRDADRVLAGIAALQADIVALQEADFRLGDRPSALPRDRIGAATGLEPLPIGRNAVSLGWHGNALLARPGIHVCGLEHLDLPGHEPRGAVIVDLDTPAPLRVVAVHLGLLRAARRRQLDAIRSALQRHSLRPTVILGDFNERSQRVGLGRIAGSFVILPTAPTFPSRRPFLPLDRIVHSLDLELVPLSHPRTTGPQASDHLPLLAELRWL
ncbi:endonuclease/exonuclease/phosphatase family protein [Tabrizicola sp.]|uniref:endonuclease/exonuclease/phosphatase family protein n=1 Tax=Tabrizicola sp. TaxID=2005166 RepID=UPI002735CE71|nr:endonuclease/exonuclease/phosphatase family protein [Tabrizicola sp.]MDP3197753.1 endonuclease/exonuclease/phosphatase family protein [Tabrizicola sp.]